MAVEEKARTDLWGNSQDSKDHQKIFEKSNRQEDKKSWVKQKVHVKIFQQTSGQVFRHGGPCPAWRPNHFSATSDLRFGIAHEFFVTHGQALEKLANLTRCASGFEPPRSCAGFPMNPQGINGTFACLHYIKWL